MKRASEFFKSTLIGGIFVILPSAIFIFVLSWIFELVRNLIHPLTKILMTQSPLQGIVADALVIILLIIACFVVGAIVRTRIGKWLYSYVESRILLRFPGYSLIKETVSQFLGNKKSPFSSVALARIFQNNTLVSSFITDEHADGSYTVFVPTGPNPTSGSIYHLQREYVHPVDISVEDAMRSIISCGAGSSRLIEKYAGVTHPDAPADEDNPQR